MLISQSGLFEKERRVYRDKLKVHYKVIWMEYDCITNGRTYRRHRIRIVQSPTGDLHMKACWNGNCRTTRFETRKDGQYMIVCACTNSEFKWW
jgi:hypothetical protein